MRLSSSAFPRQHSNILSLVLHGMKVRHGTGQHVHVDRPKDNAEKCECSESVRK